jgi:serine/threonine protein kinase
MKKWCIEILEGLEYLHSKGVIHFDIKPANIFLEELDRVKLGDLGLARHLNDIPGGFRGTPCYVSPQIINEENIDEKTDIW